jgi:hypothetical protein
MPLMLRNLLLVTGTVGFFVCVLLFIYYPAVPRSVLGWLALVFVGLPVWFFLEWLGNRALGMRFLTQFSSPVRIIVALPFVIALGALCIFLVQFVQKLVSLT